LKIKSQKDFWSGLMFVIIGLAFTLAALNHPFGHFAAPGPGLLPLALGMLLALLGALLLFKSLSIEAEGGDPLRRLPWRALFGVVGGVALFGLLLPRAGLGLTLPVVLLCAASADREGSWRERLVVAGALTLMFVLLLGPVFHVGLAWGPRA
jgi:NhaP-type Na+/H+ or K+/H+ antiporter